MPQDSASDFHTLLTDPVGYFVNHGGEEMAVVLGAPIAFTIAVALAVFIAWYVFRFLHQRQLDQIPILEGRLKARDDEIARLNQLLKEASEQGPGETAKSTTSTDNLPSTDNEMLYPPSGGVLWRWDPEKGTIGPFCPVHPQEYLFLRNQYFAGKKTRDFEKDHLSFNWFVCPINEVEEFKSLQKHANRVFELRAQVTERFRTRFGQKGQPPPKDWNGTLEIEYIHSELQWRKTGEDLRFLSHDYEAPRDALLYLRIRAKLIAVPPRLIEDVLLSLTGDLIRERDWAPEYIDQREVSLCFSIPSRTSPGKYPAQLTVRALGPNGGIIEKRSRGFDAIIARSYGDFQRFSDIS
jgi:hypothetical protein